ncbi:MULTISPECIES: DUF3718 domain-containing protein [unclassified Colwellia]|uniref:DUF3718 domain-containing protein n=1 Tax=unclassified Colwellia TaxID=196834 RepID=UPI0015F4178F|nr:MULTISPECIES: DUF3718 domain-containing protein [unclassified Colwellia]MBA6231599.1 DUF3718 domain-containing protein [Colwellia sp. MB02u-7]MBA6235463.1 DUF3718 domain-containing protein [Colwellia sp. MB02u-11]MBA6258015.1 DUF3718 domain-containing protein [Colwellia sp. MB3u-28]MBA6259309.1 DUF3718 domain-containing protein [Colwellia sp. MB3u-41]MBA6299795.1 DUF3718 domain-containing protein [Colwellia sp. MB3u-22]
MKNLTLAVVFVLLAFNSNATKYEFIATDSSIETKMCVFAGNNNKDGLKKALRLRMMSSAINSKRFTINSTTCNDMAMAHFAYKYDALDTFSYLNHFTSKKDKIPTTSVEIKDIAAVFNRKNEDTKIIYVGLAK